MKTFKALILIAAFLATSASWASNVQKCVNVTVNSYGYYNSVATAVVLRPGQGATLPNPGSVGSYLMEWWDATKYVTKTLDPKYEQVLVTAIATDTLTIIRGQNGTTASTKNTAPDTYQMFLGCYNVVQKDSDVAIMQGGQSVGSTNPLWVQVGNPCNTSAGTPTCTPTNTPLPTNSPTSTFTPIPTNTFTNTPTPNWTTTPTPTPFSFNFSVDTSTSTAVTIAAAVAGYKINLRGLTIENTNSTSTTSGAFYIDDGSVTVYGPVTLYGMVGTNVSIPYYAQGINRPLRFVNVNSVADMAGCVNYSIDLPGVK